MNAKKALKKLVKAINQMDLMDHEFGVRLDYVDKKYSCRRCGQNSVDVSKIVHEPDCPVIILRKAFNDVKGIFFTKKDTV